MGSHFTRASGARACVCAPLVSWEWPPTPMGGWSCGTRSSTAELPEAAGFCATPLAPACAECGACATGSWSRGFGKPDGLYGDSSCPGGDDMSSVSSSSRAYESAELMTLIDIWLMPSVGRVLASLSHFEEMVMLRLAKGLFLDSNCISTLLSLSSIPAYFARSTLHEQMAICFPCFGPPMTTNLAFLNCSPPSFSSLYRVANRLIFSSHAKTPCTPVTEVVWATLAPLFQTTASSSNEEGRLAPSTILRQ
mmetsp:Transcript_48657/g.118524  ORF Transcript_48657/g.118524 Transcript_48657/m.118524 type:complete len:251 (-) Transcript_48657:267-1019(-)